MPFKVFFITAPFDQPNSGDGDYVRALERALCQKIDGSAVYLQPRSTSARSFK